MPRYAIHARCMNFGCGHKYKWNVEAPDREAVDRLPDKPCPKCSPSKRKKKEAVQRHDTYETASPPIEHTGIDGVIASGRAPGINGANIRVQAIDTAANIVMEDYGISDLKTNTRAGDTMVPDLTPRQREMNENFWGGKRGKKPMIDRAAGQKLVQSAMGGQFLAGSDTPRTAGETNYGGDVLTALHRRRVRAPTHTIGVHDPRKEE